MKRPRTRGSALLQALAGIAILTAASLYVFQCASTLVRATNFDASRRAAQDLIAARATAWKQGSAVAVETGVFASGSAYRFTPEVTTNNGVDQMRMEVIWSEIEALPVSGATWRWRCTAIAIRIPSS